MIYYLSIAFPALPGKWEMGALLCCSVLHSCENYQGTCPSWSPSNSDTSCASISEETAGDCNMEFTATLFPFYWKL